MNIDMQGHNHGGKNHLLGMLGIFAVIVLVLLAAGRSFGEALPLAAVLACPVMMIGMMFMMRGENHDQHADSAIDHDHAAPLAPSGAVSASANEPPTRTGLPTPRNHH
jgi:hypothetical protein